MSRKTVSAQFSQFDFNPVEKVYFHKHLYSQYSQRIGKAATQLRDLFEMVQMNPIIAVNYSALVVHKNEAAENGLGENYATSFVEDGVWNDAPPSPLLIAGVHEGHGAIDSEGEIAYMSKAQVLEVFEQFVNEHRAKDFVSREGKAKMQFVSIAHKVRTFIQLLDDKACRGMVASIDVDPNEPSFSLAVDYMEPEALISLNLYAP